MAQTDVLIAGRYRMGRLLGSGGFGSVYLATDERLHRPVAIKICSTQRLPPAEAAEAAQLFQSEALTLARLRHPGLTAIWDYFNEGDDWYLVMEYVPGQTLRDLLRGVAGPLPQAEALDYTRQLCAVLGYLHRQHPPVVFRDLKPANVIVTPDGQLKLIDFGIARLFSPGKTADTAQFGTPGYAPPEQYGGQTEPRSDLYSLGVVLHQMLTGHNPASSPFALPPIRSLNPSIPEGLEALVQEATAYHIGDRVPSADDFCQQLDAALLRPAPPIAQPRIVTHSPSHHSTNPTTSRPVWTPGPQRLPQRPMQEQGFGRGLVMLFLLTLLLGSLAVGGFLLRDQIAGISRELLEPIVVPATPVSLGLPRYAVFSAPSDVGNENLYRIDLRTGQTRALTQLPPQLSYSQPTVSPDGTEVAFTRETRDFDEATKTWRIETTEVWVRNLDGGDERSVVSGYALSRSPAWSPDGKWLAIETADAGRAWRDHDIVLVDPRTGTARGLVTTQRWEGGPAWSPDGAEIAFHARRESSCMQIMVVGVGDGRERPVTQPSSATCTGPGGGDFWPDWSSTGIAFGRKSGGQEQLVVVDDGGAESVLDTGDAPAGHPRWTANGRHLLFEQGKAAAVVLARYDLQTDSLEPLDTQLSGSHLADW